MGDKVMVGCKLPNGVVLHLHESVKGPDGRPRNRILPDTDVKLNGFAVPFGKSAPHEIRGGFGLTLVDADFWEQWYKLNGKTSPLAVNGIVFAHETPEAAQAEAVMRSKDVKSGLEPLAQKPGDDPRVPKQLETATKD
jgi:hypothetical protein